MLDQRIMGDWSSGMPFTALSPGANSGPIRIPHALTESLRNRFVGQYPTQPMQQPFSMPQMPQVPTMGNLPMQGGMVDFNALAGLLAPGFGGGQQPVKNRQQIAPPPGKVPGMPSGLLDPSMWGVR